MLGYVLLCVGICTIALRIPIPLYLGAWDCVDVSDGHLMRVHVSGLGYRRLLHLQHVCVSPMRRGRGVTLKFLFFCFGVRAIQLGSLAIKGYQAERYPDATASFDTKTEKPSKIALVLKLLHAISMIYSFIMLLGAGISFLKR
jgi:hypothetical protein